MKKSKNTSSYIAIGKHCIDVYDDSTSCFADLKEKQYDEIIILNTLCEETARYRYKYLEKLKKFYPDFEYTNTTIRMKLLPTYIQSLSVINLFRLLWEKDSKDDDWATKVVEYVACTKIPDGKLLSKVVAKSYELFKQGAYCGGGHWFFSSATASLKSDFDFSHLNDEDIYLDYCTGLDLMSKDTKFGPAKKEKDEAPI